MTCCVGIAVASWTRACAATTSRCRAATGSRTTGRVVTKNCSGFAKNAAKSIAHTYDLVPNPFYANQARHSCLVRYAKAGTNTKRTATPYAWVARPRQASAAGAGLPKAARRECRFVQTALGKSSENAGIAVVLHMMTVGAVIPTTADHFFH